MADPQHIPELDPHDRRTVRLYRLGLSIAAVGVLFLSAWSLGAERLLPSGGERGLRWLSTGTSFGVALAVANLHLYAKSVRWVIVTAGVFGLWFMALAGGLSEGVAEHLVFHVGLGLVFVVLSALALKEQFCFRIPGLKLVPLFLATAMIPAVTGHLLAFGALLLPAGGLLVVLCVAKWRMPLGHDVGDKSRYQV